MGSITLRLLYVPTTPPRRNPSVRERYALTCASQGEQWSVRPPGVFTARGETFTPEPEFVHAWLGGASAPFGAVAAHDEVLLPSEAQFRAFVKSLEPVLCGTSEHSDLARLVAVFPGDAGLLLERANLAARLGHPLGEVTKDVDAALALREDVDSLLTASNALHAAGDLGGAIALLQRVLARDPEHDDATNHFLQLLEMESRLDEWLSVEEARAVRRPRAPMEWTRRALMLERLGRLAEAAESLAQSLALRDDAVSRVQRAKLLAKLTRDDEALVELDAGLARSADLDGHLLRADLLIRRNDLEAAQKELRWLALAASHREVAEERLRKIGVA